MTQTFWALSRCWMYRATAGPWTASLPRPRKKFVHPFCVRPGLVADGVMLTRPAALRAGPMARDSPENGRPTRPRTAGLLISPVVGPTAVSGVPPVSARTSVTWQFGFAALCWSTASCAALTMAMPSAAFWPAMVPA